MNKHLIRLFRRAHWKDDPENPGGGGSTAPDAGGGSEASADAGETGEAVSSKEEPDPYLADPRIASKLRAEEPPKETSAPEEDHPAEAKGGEEEEEDESQYSERVRKRIGKERAKRGEIEAENARLREELAQLRTPSRPAAEPSPVHTEEPTGTEAGPLPPGKFLRYDAAGKPLEPREEDFVDEETGLADPVKLARAWGKFEVESERFVEKQERAVSERTAAVEQAWDQAEQTFRGATPDYDQVAGQAARALFDGQEVKDASGKSLGFQASAPKAGAEVLVYAITERQNPALLYELGRNPQLVDRLKTLRPRVLATALDQVEARLALGSNEARPAPNRQPPKAPAVPPRLPLGGGGTEEVLTRESVRGKNPRELVSQLDKIDESMQRGTFFR